MEDDPSEENVCLQGTVGIYLCFSFIFLSILMSDDVLVFWLELSSERRHSRSMSKLFGLFDVVRGKTPIDRALKEDRQAIAEPR